MHAGASVIERAGPRAGRVHRFDSLLRIGRAAENDIMVHDALVSRFHAEIRCTDDQFVLVDLASKNGTALNGRRLDSPVHLTNGDEIQVGELSLTFHVDESTLTGSVQVLLAVPVLIVDHERGEVRLAEVRIDLTRKEFVAVATLDKKRGKLVTKDQLAEAVWPEHHGQVGDENVDQLISRLRHKLERNKAPRYLVTVRGMGYRLEARSTSEIRQ